MVSSTLFSLLFYTYPFATYIIMYGPNQLPPPISSDGINIPSCDVCIKKDDSTRAIFYELVSQMRFNNKENSIFIEFVQYFSDVLSNKLINDDDDEETKFFKKLDTVEYFLKNLKIGGTIKEYKSINDPKKILIVSTNAQRCCENALRLNDEGTGPIYDIPTIKPDILPPSYNLPARIGIDDVLRIRKGVYCMIRINDLSRNLIKGQIVQIVDIKVNKYNNVDSIDVIRVNDNNNNNNDNNNNDNDNINNNKDDNMNNNNNNNNNNLNLTKMLIPTDYSIYINSKDDDDDDDKKKKNHNKKKEKEYVSVYQFPITLSYSLTAHSAQGKTLDCNIGIQLKHYNNNNNNIINSYFVAITRVRESKQIYMNFHPAHLLYPLLNIKTVDDVIKLRKQFIHKSPSNFIDFVNNYKRKNLFNNDNDNNLQNINELCKKICLQK